MTKRKRTEEDRRNRRRDRDRERRENETPLEKQERLARQKKRVRKHRENQSKLETQQRLTRDSNYVQARRQNESELETQQRLERHRNYVRELRQNESELETQQRLTQVRDYVQARRQNESELETQQRLTQVRDYVQARRQNESELETQQRLTQVRNYVQERRQQHRAESVSVRPDFATSVDALSNSESLDFAKFEDDPEAAAILFYLNSGFLHFSGSTDDIVNKIDGELMSEEEKQDCIDQFQSAQSPFGPIHSCGACGIKAQPCQEVDLADLDVLHMKDDQLERWEKEKNTPSIMIPTSSGDWISVHPAKLRSVYESQYATFNLHPELVHTRNNVDLTFVCESCAKAIRKDTIPKNSIAAGIDFGLFERLGLTYPNIAEQAILARARLYRKIVKIENQHGAANPNLQTTLKSHMIVFGHDAPAMASRAIDPNNFENVTFLFLGNGLKELDKLAQETFNSARLVARAFVLYQWLAVLKAVNSLFDDIVLPSMQEVETTTADYNQSLHNNAMYKDYVTVDEAALGDDVASVRHGTNNDSMPSSFVMNPNDGHTCVERALDQVARTIGEPVHSHREANPVNEFSDNERLLCSVFPFIFMYGHAYQNNSQLTSDQVQHLLLQFSNVPATSKELIFLLFNQSTRHGNARGMAAKVRGNPTAYDTFAKVITSEPFRERLRKAVQNPRSKDAKYVLKKVMPVLQLAQRNSNIGAVTANQLTSHITAMTQFFGPGSVFFTIAPDDVNNPKTLRFAQKLYSNNEYPAVVANSKDFLDAMLNDSVVLGVGNVPIPVGWTERARAANENSVATALQYRNLVNNLLTILFGVTLDKDKRRTHYYLQSKKGIFGHLTAVIGVHEVQARGALHLHIILYGGLSPELLEVANNMPTLCQKVANALDSIYRARFDIEVHAADIISKSLKKQDRLPLENPSLCSTRSLKVADVPIVSANISRNKQFHRHTFTCHKPPNGKENCRLGVKEGLRETTCSVQLKEVTEDEQGKNEHSFVVQESIDPPQSDIERQLGPLLRPDRRVIVWEIDRPALPELNDIPNFEIDNDARTWLFHQFRKVLSRSIDSHSVDISSVNRREDDPWANQRAFVLGKLNQLPTSELRAIYVDLQNELPSRNGYVVTHVPLISALCGCNHNAKHLGNAVQSQAAMYYMRDYVAKDKAALSHLLTAVKTARDDIEKPEHKSQADDAGTDKRMAQHWLVRTLNLLDLEMEVSDTQAVASLLGMQSEVVTDHFVLTGIHQSYNYVRDKINQARLEILEPFIKERSDGESSGLHGYESSDGFVVPEEMEESNNDNTTVTVGGFSTLDHTHEEENHELLLAQTQFDLAQAEDSGWGSATIYSVQEGDRTVQVPVYFEENYQYRGEAFAKLNRVEFRCLTKVDNIRLRDDTGTGTASIGRNATTMHRFGPGHKLEAVKALYLRSKQGIPLHNGKLPPLPELENIPATDDPEYPAWKQVADAFAAYCLTAFRPELNNYDRHHRDLSLKYDWQTFVSWVTDLRRDTSFIAHARYQLMMRTIFALKTENKTKVMLNSYRFRNVDFWHEHEQNLADQYWTAQGNRRVNQDTAADFMNPMDDGLDRGQTRSGQLMTQFSKSVLNGLDSAMGTVEEIGSGSARNSTTAEISDNPMEIDEADPRKGFVDVATVRNTQLYEELQRVRTGAAHDHDDESELSDSSASTQGDVILTSEPFQYLPTMEAQARQVISNATPAGGAWTHSQKRLLDVYIEVLKDLHFNGKEPYKDVDPPVYLCTGGPGTGKTTVLKVFQPVAEKFHLAQPVLLTYMGVAAQNAGGKTFYFTLQHSVTDPVKIHNLNDASKLQQLQNDLGIVDGGHKVPVVVIDEVSMITPVMLAILDSRLRQATGNSTTRFGGCPVFFFGDFSQLPPPKKASIVTHLMRFVEGTVNLQRHLQNKRNQQNNNPERMPLIRNTKKRKKKLDSEAPNYREDTVLRRGLDLFRLCRWYPLEEQVRSVDGIHTEMVINIGKGNAFTMADLQRYKTLSIADRHDPTWQFAPILVSTNRERFDLCDRQARAFAKKHNTHVIRWKNIVRQWKGRPKHKQNMDACVDDDPVFWQYFVVGAPIYVNKNINPSLQLANGSNAHLHSISLSTTAEQEALEEQLSRAPIGSMITLDRPPQTVNVELFRDDVIARARWTGPNYCNHDNRDGSANTEHPKVVVPLMRHKEGKRGYGNSSNSFYMVRGGTGFRYMSSRAQTYLHFPYDLGFAMTFHKAQGRTMSRVILVLSARPARLSDITFEGLFVAMSRVRKGEHIRILMPTGETLDSLRYLTALKPMPEINQFFKGFHGIGSAWDMQSAYDARLKARGSMNN